MRKAIERFRQLSLFLVVFIPFAFILYFFLPWNELKSILPLPVFLQIQRFVIPFIAISSWLFFPALLTLKHPITGNSFWFAIRAIMLSLGIPFCCIFSYASLLRSAPETIYNSAQLDNYKYYLAVTVDDFVTYDVYKCNEKDLDCKVVFHELGEKSITSTTLTVNQSLKTIDVYRNGQVIFTVESTP